MFCFSPGKEAQEWNNWGRQGRIERIERIGTNGVKEATSNKQQNLHKTKTKTKKLQ